jgi:hypothetical protein
VVGSSAPPWRDRADLTGADIKSLPDSDTRMCLTLDTDALQQGDLFTWLVAEPVLPVLLTGYDAGSSCSCHTAIVSAGVSREQPARSVS